MEQTEAYNAMLKQFIYDIMRKRVGKRNAITAEKVREVVSAVCGKYDNDRHTSYSTRKLIEEVMIETRLPIAATSYGYFVIETPEEYAEYIENLQGRIAGIKKRITVVNLAYYSDKQIRLAGV